MNKLKRLIAKYFVFCCLGVSVSESVVDSTFGDILLPFLAMKFPESKLLALLTVMMYFLLLILLFFVGAYIFYRLAGKAIVAESKRQVQQQNLLYSYITHDLKTPMTSVQGFASALRDGKIKPEEQGEILDIIYQKSQYMNDLIETLFRYSKMGTESYTLNLKKTNLCSLVRDLAAVHYSEFEDRNMELEIEIPDEAIFRQLDEKEFCRAVNNLIVNAYKHNPKGTAVLIKVHAKNNAAFVTVADNGREISEELAKTMFQPFVSGNASRTSGTGSGLGLAISQMIVKKHGGQLYMEGGIDGYTKRFVIALK